MGRQAGPPLQAVPEPEAARQPGPPWPDGAPARELWEWGERQLRAAAVANAGREAAELLGALLAAEWSAVWREPHRPVSGQEAERFTTWIEGRCLGEPAAYLTGWCRFYGRRFRVVPGLLVPRPETEQLVWEAGRLLAASRRTPPRVVELGTGTGAVAVTVAAETPAAVLATDLAPTALATAWQNARDHGVLSRVILVAGDLWTFRCQPLPAPFAGLTGRGRAPQVDLVVANPPYVTGAEWYGLAREVRREPRAALVPAGGVIPFYRRLVLGAVQVLRRDTSFLILEVGAGRVGAPAVAAILRGTGFFHRVRVAVDGVGRPRVVIGERQRSVAEPAPGVPVRRV